MKYIYIYIYMKKNKIAERNWATAQLSCEKKKKKFVLQPCNCIVRERAGKKKKILQYNYCIAGWKVAWPEGDVVSQYKKCIVAEIWPRGLYCKRRLRRYCRNCIAMGWHCIAI